MKVVGSLHGGSGSLVEISSEEYGMLQNIQTNLGQQGMTLEDVSIFDLAQHRLWELLSLKKQLSLINLKESR